MFITEIHLLLLGNTFCYSHENRIACRACLKTYIRNIDRASVSGQKTKDIT